MDERTYWLLNPGPVNASEAVRRAALRPDLCHREPEYSALMAGVRGKLLKVAGVGPELYTSALISGSGTAAIELGVASIVQPGRKLLVVVNGVYGERVARMAEVHGIERVVLESPWGQRPDLARIEQVLRDDPAVAVVALIHHETTTGLLNPVEAVGELCRRHDRLFFLDAVSSFGGEALDLARANVDFMAATANKCLHALPGVAFLLVSRRGQAHAAEVAPRSVYFDLGRYIAEQDAGTVPFTPCVPGMYTLDAALDDLLFGGVAERIAIYRARAAYLRRELTRLGLELYLDPAVLSNSITTFRLPAGVTYRALHDALKADGFVIYAGQGKLASEIFRVANMGEVPMGAYESLVASVRFFLNGARSPAAHA